MEMATNTADPARQGRYNLKIGDSLSGSSDSTAGFSSVRFNHKPQVVSQTVTLTTKSQEPKLHIHDTQDRTYDYDGSRTDLEETYALIFNNQDQTCTLERVGKNYDFNLASASHDNDLADRFPPLSLVDSEGAHTDGSNGSARTSLDTGPDASNPFDFRHFLVQQHNGRDASTSPSPQPSPPQRASVVETKRPVTKSTPQTNPLKKTQPKQLKKMQPRAISANHEATAPVRSRAAVSKAAPKATASAKSKPPPKSEEFIVDSSSSPEPATAGATHASDSDQEDDTTSPNPSRNIHVGGGGGGLEIDLGDDSPPHRSGNTGGLEIDFGDEPNPRKKAMSLLYAGSGGASKRGPISLRSAANSPNPNAMHASSKRHQPEEINLSFDFDGGEEDADDDDDDGHGEVEEEIDVDDEDMDRGHRHQRTEVDDQSEDEDVDVEPMHIGSPAHVQRTGSLGNALTAEGDDFEAQMLQALAGEGDEDGYAGHADESEESEAD